MKAVCCALLAILALASATTAPSAVELFFRNKLDCIDKDGFVTLAELKQFADVMDPVEADEEPRTLSDETMRPFLRQLDTDSDGLISWDEFHTQHHELAAVPAAGSPAPQQIHLALHTASTEMTVRWMADSPSTAGYVRLSTSPNGPWQVFTGGVTNYTLFNNLYVSLPIFTVLVQGLTPCGRYYYQVGDNTTWSSTISFQAAVDSSCSSQQSVVSWLVYGDMGTVIPMGASVTKAILKEQAVSPFQITLHVGDLAYAGVNKNGEWEPTWDAWMNQIQPFASVMPYMTSVGNHESYYNYSSYTARFAMPGNETGGYDNYWFSFNFNNVHVTSFSTEHDYAPGSEQYEWMANDMAQARAAGYEWLFLSGHRPFYSSDTSEYDSHKPGCRLLTELEDLIAKFKVDLVLTGHMHCYERTWPTYNGTVIGSTTNSTYFEDPAAPIYIVQGTAGALQIEKWVTPQPAWSLIRQQYYGFGRMDIEGNTIRYYYKNWQDGSVLDSFTLVKNSKKRPHQH